MFSDQSARHTEESFHNSIWYNSVTSAKSRKVKKSKVHDLSNQSLHCLLIFLNDQIVPWQCWDGFRLPGMQVLLSRGWHCFTPGRNNWCQQFWLEKYNCHFHFAVLTAGLIQAEATYPNSATQSLQQQSERHGKRYSLLRTLLRTRSTLYLFYVILLNCLIYLTSKNRTW